MLHRIMRYDALVLYGLDIAAFTASMWLARALRIILPWGKPLDAAGAALPWGLFPIGIIIWTVTLSAFRAYRPHTFLDALDEAQALLAAYGVATLAFAGVLYLGHRELSRLLYLYFATLDTFIGLSARLIWRTFQKRQGRRRVLIVGAGPLGRQVARAMSSAARLGLELIGFLDEAPLALEGDFPPILGTPDEAEAIIASQNVQEVILTPGTYDFASLRERLEALPVRVLALADCLAPLNGPVRVEEVGGAIFLGLGEPPISPVERLLKRGFDLVCASILLLLASPWMGIIALWVRFTSGRPVLYRSIRIGEGGRPFTMLKFRTMVPGAEEESNLLEEMPDGRLLFLKRPDDPRVTPVGRFLRRYSLDELPQLINVLKGEMSLVGPRPELPAIVARYAPWQRQRLMVPQGMTGWWQVSGRSDKAKYWHIEDDLYYIRHYSFLLDLRILWKTIGAVLRGRGAY